MKRRFLVLVVLCLVCAATFAQTKKTTGRKPTTTRGRGTAASRNAAAAKADSSKLTPDNTKATSVAPPVQTPVAKSAVPAKPFDRPRDGYYTKSNILNAKVVPMTVLREADVVFEHRVWRDFDLREKSNQFMASPKGRLIDAIMEAVMSGELTAYDPAVSTKDDPDGDAWSTPLTPEGAKRKMADSTMVIDIDKKTGEKTGSHMAVGEYNPDSIVRFRLKEDYIFDKQRSVTEWRIVGIAPLVKPNIGSISADYQPAFWIYFPDARKVFATKEVVNHHNDATGLSYDDIFMKRLFTGYITKESNDKNERIKDYAQGVDRLYESERIKKSLLDWELNLWQY